MNDRPPDETHEAVTSVPQGVVESSLLAEDLARADEQERLLVENVLPRDARDPSLSGGKEFKPTPMGPDDHLRRLLIRLLFYLIVFAVLVDVVAMACKWFDADFGKSILQVVVGPVVGALVAAIGYLFGERKRGA